MQNDEKLTCLLSFKEKNSMYNNFMMSFGAILNLFNLHCK